MVHKHAVGFIGFVRVSSDKQAYEGESLAQQKVLLDEYATVFGTTVEIPYPCVEKGHGTSTERQNFRLTVKEARERCLPILVRDASRLSRSVKDLNLIDLRKTPVFVVGEGRVTKKRLCELVQKAEEQLEQLRIDGKQSRLRNGVSAKKPKSKAFKPKNTRAGALGNQDRAHRRVRKVQQFLNQHPDFCDLTLNQLIQKLHAADIKNLKSERTGKSIDWTVGALRPVRKAALEQIALDAEPMDELIIS
ncbi:hypothetical protein OAN307_c35350 [Octadecabacter antarcticus 307]|uniref:Resolvase/invertase-type recombinase catalytic domain-containing protein n=1 Tax=Octadecabacter antarcticus 307 TaxID=391626 RepID=M9RB85_9RHOB|nr:recombinase family protein [Octadecabacter antarcticus]AGI69013.1 hypothetical protein OAN307_c35350 [Octadecabacter antarcticus 307]